MRKRIVQDMGMELLDHDRMFCFKVTVSAMTVRVLDFIPLHPQFYV